MALEIEIELIWSDNAMVDNQTHFEIEAAIWIFREKPSVMPLANHKQE
jgi:hypothetical protein